MNSLQYPTLMQHNYDDIYPLYNLKNKRILIVEDDYANYLLFQEMLTPAKVCLIRAVSFSEAFEMISSKRVFDLIMININMSGNDNCVMVNRFKMLWPYIPVMAITSGNECKKNPRPCFPLGCDTMISFNVDCQQLLETVKEMLNPVN